MEPGLVIRKVGWAMRKAIKMMPSVTLKLIMEDSNLTIAIPGIGTFDERSGKAQENLS